MAQDDAKNIISEMKEFNVLLNNKNKTKVTSIYLGGGTPTLLSNVILNELLDKISKLYKIHKNTEITIECTPDTLTKDKLYDYKKFGINRVSMGIQRLNDSWLKSMNRGHNTKDVFRALRLLSKARIKYNVDLMYGFKGQTIKSFCKDIIKILKYSPDEITLYRFECKKRTDSKNIGVPESDKKISYSMQEAGRLILKARGYREGPDGWFTKKNSQRAQVYEDRWEKQIPLIGFGPEAYSYSKYQQYTNKSLLEYKKALSKNLQVVNSKRSFGYTVEQQEIRRMAFELKSHFETNFNKNYDKFFESLVSSDLGIIIKQGKLKIFKLNRHGIIVVEEIMRILINKNLK